MKNVVVAGGSGFIGSHLCEYLHGEGHNVYCIDNEVKGNVENVAALTDSDRFTYLKQDVCDPVQITGNVDEVYHLASPASPDDFVSLSLEIMYANSKGTERLLDLAKDKGATFLFASTSEVYGDPKIHPQTESYWGNVNPIGLRSPYDESKRFGEAFTTAYCKRHNLPYAIVRIFNTYGPRLTGDGRVIFNFLNQALQGEDITVYGDGSQTRSFCYVSDLVDGIVKAQRASKGIPINLGSSTETSIQELAESLIRWTDSKSKIVRKPLPNDDPKVRRPDTSRAQELLGWQPTVSLEEGIRKCLGYFKEKA